MCRKILRIHSPCRFRSPELIRGRENLSDMKKLILLIFLFQLSISRILIAQDSVPAPGEKGERHEFVVANFHTESGVTLPQARIVYGTYGHLNPAKDNVVLLPSHYMADFHGY